ncbi:unnamed protein product [Ambrosiozyma monospora]|uniref:Unnamed protein product n=1 Tax=Ambrosiozyma monospora TaxID=43982 RepID=A0ACB5T6Q2_AMBMO|nr:unnamed protein product [Ambrosiozyma monospora]
MRLPKRKNIISKKSSNPNPNPNPEPQPQPQPKKNTSSNKNPQKGAIKDENGIPYNYIIIIDAGSKGTRAYVYNWPSVQYMLANGHLKTTDTIDSISKNDVNINMNLANVDVQLFKRVEVELDEDEDDLNEEQPDPQHQQNEANDDALDKPNINITPKATTMNPITPLNAKSQGLPHLTTSTKWHSKLKPGITKFKDTNPSKIGPNYLTHLLKKLYTIIPIEQHYRTPIFVHATAGMRLLTPTQQSEILGEVCEFLQEESGFYLPDCDSHVNVIDGDVEGLFGWIAVNSMNGNLRLSDGKKEDVEGEDKDKKVEPLVPVENVEVKRDTVADSDSGAGAGADAETKANANSNSNSNANADTKTTKPKPEEKAKQEQEQQSPQHVDTVGLLELGGASTQISFEPSPEETNKHLNQLIKLQLSTIGSLVPDLQYNVYSTSFLGYGLTQIHDRYLEKLISQSLSSSSSSSSSVGATDTDSDLIVDPCYPTNQERLVSFNDQIYTIVGSGDFNRCNELIYPLLIKDLKECSSDKPQPEVSSCLLTDSVPHC